MFLKEEKHSGVSDLVEGCELLYPKRKEGRKEGILKVKNAFTFSGIFKAGYKL